MNETKLFMALTVIYSTLHVANSFQIQSMMNPMRILEFSSHHHSVKSHLSYFLLRSSGYTTSQCFSTVTSTTDNVAVKSIPAHSPIEIHIESKWRQEAQSHAERMYSLLSPGMLPMEETTSSKSNQKRNRKSKRQQTKDSLPWRGLDSYNPIYNFLIEYYGIRGAKGCRKLARWSPPLSSSLSSTTTNDVTSSTLPSSFTPKSMFLEGACSNDFGNGGVLHLRGAYLTSSSADDKAYIPPDSNHNHDEDFLTQYDGITYNPSLYFSQKEAKNENDDQKDEKKKSQKQAIPYLWYYTILSQTYTNTNPITHCFGLHEWAMLYHPPTSTHPPPPSAKYQAHLPRRVSQEIINAAVERKGVSCTHFDAIRFFTPDAIPLLNDATSEKSISSGKDEHSSSASCSGNCSGIQTTNDADNRKTESLPVERSDQASMEQPACVHANMDLFKIALKLSPFISSTLLGDALEVAISARKLDVAASPYDSSTFGLEPVCVETMEGRKIYKERQIELMERGQVVRRKLLVAYEDFLLHAFGEDVWPYIIKSRNNQNDF